MRCATFAGLMFLACSGTGTSAQVVDLFHLINYKDNELHYYGHLQNCRWGSAGEAVQAEWIMRTKSNSREPMDRTERRYLSVANASVEGGGETLGWRLLVFDQKTELTSLQFMSTARTVGGDCKIRTRVTVRERTMDLGSIRYVLSIVGNLKSLEFNGTDETGKALTVTLRW